MLIRRKWGSYLTLIGRRHFKVKLLWFDKDKAISEQFHKKRDELWLILKGAGHMKHYHFNYNPKSPYENIELKTGDWHHIGSHSWHKFTASKDTLVLEIQYGDKCDEGDIERKDV